MYFFWNKFQAAHSYTHLWNPTFSITKKIHTSNEKIIWSEPITWQKHTDML